MKQDMKKRIAVIAVATVTALTLGIVGIVLSGVMVARAAPPAVMLAQRNNDEKGVLIARVESDGPAARAGLRRGDIILKLADVEVNTTADVAAFLAGHKPGDSVTVTVMRGDAMRTFSVTLGDQNGRAYTGLALAIEALPVDGPGRPGVFPPRIYPRSEPPEVLTVTATRSVSVPRALIVEVLTDTPAAKAGLVAGDVISAVNGVSVDMSNTLAALIGQHKPGDRVTLEVVGADRQTRAVTVTLGANPDDASKAYLGVQYTFAGPMWGRRVLPPAPRLPVAIEIVVRDVVAGSPAATAGLKVNDVILSLDGAGLDDPRALVDAIGRRKPGDTITLEVRRSNETFTVSVRLGENPDRKGAAYLGVSLAARPRLNMPDDDGRGGWNLPDDLFKMLPDLFDKLPRLPAQQRPPVGESL